MSKYKYDSTKQKAVAQQTVDEFISIGALVSEITGGKPISQRDLPFLCSKIYLCGVIDGKQEERSKRK